MRFTHAMQTSQAPVRCKIDPGYSAVVVILTRTAAL